MGVFSSGGANGSSAMRSSQPEECTVTAQGYNPIGQCRTGPPPRQKPYASTLRTSQTETELSGRTGHRFEVRDLAGLLDTRNHISLELFTPFEDELFRVSGDDGAPPPRAATTTDFGD
jgi:hypothetical protein